MASTRNEPNSKFTLQYNNGIPFGIKDHSGLLTTSQIAIGETADFIRQNRVQSLECHEVVITLPFPLADQALQLFDGVLKGRFTSVFSTIFKTSLSGDIQQSYELGNCEIMEITFPTLDATSREPGTATIKLKPEYIDVSSGGTSSRAGSPGRAPVRTFISGNFSLAIDSIETSRVREISAVRVLPHLQPAANQLSNSAFNTKNNLEFIEFKTITITMSQSELDKPGWQGWLNEFVKNQQEGKSGILKFLQNDLRSSVLEISLHNIFIVSTLYQGSKTDEIPKATIELMFDAASINGTTKEKEKEKVQVVRSGLEILLPDLSAPVKPKITKAIRG